MPELSSIFVSCHSPERILAATAALNPMLTTQYSAQLARKLRDITWNYWQLYGEQGLFDRVNNKSLAQIFEEYNEQHPPRVIEQSEINGVSFTLVAAPDEYLSQ